mmetsp:Transcript_59258/g.125974  ORF Transcript_59258/g.125974 Transcript_59258/m.125974 type:complete len:204 (+) Transcript_59258:162-773(+)
MPVTCMERVSVSGPRSTADPPAGRRELPSRPPPFNFLTIDTERGRLPRSNSDTRERREAPFTTFCIRNERHFFSTTTRTRTAKATSSPAGGKISRTGSREKAASRTVARTIPTKGEVVDCGRWTISIEPMRIAHRKMTAKGGEGTLRRGRRRGATARDPRRREAILNSPSTTRPSSRPSDRTLPPCCSRPVLGPASLTSCRYE